MASDGPTNLVFIRVTLLGCAKSGKSSLVNNVVNNAFSVSYNRTTEAALYYTTVRIQGNPSEEDSGHSTLVEIEDTFASNDVGTVSLQHGTKERQINDFYDFYWPYTKEQKKKELDELKKRGEETDNAGAKDKSGIVRSIDKPLSMMKPPTDGIFRPLTSNRMAFLIVFDSNDENSYTEGVRIYEQLREYHENKKDKMNPLLFFVANKIDQDPTSRVHREVIQSAQAYADFKGVPLHKVSALQFKGVKKLFRNVVQAVRACQVLWLQDSGSSKTEDKKDENQCSLQ